MGFLETLTLIFVVLKLTGVVAWSWFWVLSPMIPALLLYGVFLFIFILAVREKMAIRKKINARKYNW